MRLRARRACPPLTLTASCRLVSRWDGSSLLVGNLKKKYAQGFLPEKLQQQDHTPPPLTQRWRSYLQGSVDRGCWAFQVGPGSGTSARLEGSFPGVPGGSWTRNCVNMVVDKYFPQCPLSPVPRKQMGAPFPGKCVSSSSQPRGSPGVTAEL